MKIKNKLNKIGNSWIFLIVVLIFYLIILFVDINLFNSCLKFFYNIFIKILPIFVLVFALMAITNYFVTPKFIMKYLGKKGIRKWFFVIVGGILSSGPIYMWYPLLSDLKSKGLSYGLIACFLYNRAIKIPLIPLMIFYFSIQYVVVLMLGMIFVSVVQGILINKIFMKGGKNK